MGLRNFIANWKNKAGQLKYEIIALYWAYRDPRTPWYAKAFMALMIGYALSPIDLVPDFIPILGYVDDLIIIPAGIYLAIKMIPQNVFKESREKARLQKIDTKIKWVIAGIIILVWVMIVLLVVRLIWH
jgi:uncharacterized membrane protein YkvA (DUF1232 family)